MALKPYVRIILVVGIFALWIALGQVSKLSGTAATGGCGCGEGPCAVTPSTHQGK